MKEEGKGQCCLFGGSLTWLTRMRCWGLADLRQALDCQEWWLRPIILVPRREAEAGDCCLKSLKLASTRQYVSNLLTDVSDTETKCS